MNPLLSIAVPVRNGENFLEQCLESIRTANRGRFEVVVSNNRSSDGTAAILERFLAIMPELKVIQTPRDFGPSENFNFVASQCSGKWVKFLCHDDLMFPNAIDHIEAAIGTTTERTALIGNREVYLFRSGGQSAPLIPLDSPLQVLAFNGLDYVEKAVAGKCAVPGISTACVRRSVFEEVEGFNLRYLHMDTFLWHELLLDYDYVRIENALVLNRVHGGQITASVRKSNRSMQEHREFWPTFLQKLEMRKKPSLKTVVKLKSKWLFVASRDAAIYFRRGELAQAVRILASTKGYLPVAILGFLRALLKESQRVKEFGSQVSNDEVYS
jgi:glycosyltransferase involved in cell wall biosynthesis